jgi:hypothetical protein
MTSSIGMEIEDVMGTLYSTEHPDVEPRKRDAVKETFNKVSLTASLLRGSTSGCSVE